ncbi:MAG TPA: acyl carrier protein [Streptosporangiaceae bacterium]|nr:acyl carrier protein [Streptosporangiaceae bacterium]
MAHLTLEDLKATLRAAAGEDDSIDLDGDILDTEFGELGYDSLAILETASLIGRRFGVQLPEDEVGELQTPRQLIDFVNATLSAKV